MTQKSGAGGKRKGSGRYGLKKSKNYHKTTVYLFPDQVKKLHKIHVKTRVPISEYIRYGVDLILEELGLGNDS